MSFTSDIKKELTKLPSSTGTLLALIQMNGALGISGNLTLSVITENAATAQYIYKMLRELYNVQADLRYYQKENLDKNRVYNIYINENVNDLLDELSLADTLMLDNGVPDFIWVDKNIQKDYLRGAFLSTGSISNPEKGNYSLEIKSLYQEHSEDLVQIGQDFGLHPKLMKHKNRYVFYLIRAEEIMDFLTLIGAMHARLRFEDAKIVREMRGLANRQSNFETANISKTVMAAQNIIFVIRQLINSKKLPPELTEIAYLRLQHPEASLQELGKMLNPPLGKSGVNHRLRKIVAVFNEK